MTKKPLYVTVVGQAMSGKTGIMKLFMKALKDNNIDVEPIWSSDGEPAHIEPEFEQRRLNSIANKTKVILAEHQASRRPIRSDSEAGSELDLNIQVVYDEDKGYGMRLVIMGQHLEKWFGTFAASKERARSVAARLSAELDLNVQDLVPREYEWVQPQ